MSFWVIWSERNKIVWNEGFFNPLFMASWAPKLLEEYQRFHPPKVKQRQRPLSNWELPPRGRLKMNIDGAFRYDLNLGGIGVIVRDEKGRCMAALYRTIKHVSSAIFVEAEAFRAGMLLALHQGWNNLILESDCATLVTAVNTLGEDYSDIGPIIGDCKDYMLAITSLNVRHIYREANCVAHRLAHVASFSIVDDCWIDNTPSIIEDVIYEDIHPPTRGLVLSPPRCNSYCRS